MTDLKKPVNLPPGQEKDRGAVPEAGFIGRVIDKLGIVFAIGLIVSALILINEVILRYVFNSPTIWAHETTIFICGMTFIYGGLYCAARDQHIRVVLLYDAVPKEWRRVLNVFISIISAAAAGMFAWASWTMVTRAAFTPDGTFRLERSGSAWDPVYPGLVKVSLFVIMSVLCIQFLVLTYNYLRGQK